MTKESIQLIEMTGEIDQYDAVCTECGQLFQAGDLTFQHLCLSEANCLRMDRENAEFSK